MTLSPVHIIAVARDIQSDLRANLESIKPFSHSRRFVGGRGGFDCTQRVSVRGRFGRRRFDPNPCYILRNIRPETILWPNTLSRHCELPRGSRFCTISPRTDVQYPGGGEGFKE